MKPDFEQLVAESLVELDEKIRLNLFALARNPKVGVWVDSNVMMYSGNEFKQQLLGFTELRTVPEVVVEVRKRASSTSYLLDEFQKVGGVTVGRDSFEVLHLSDLFYVILSHAASYSPFTQGAIVDNLNSNGSTSPIANNSLETLTAASSFLESPDDAVGLTTALGVAGRHKTACKKLRKAWFKYHREREQRVAAKTYLWTDETLVASAITDAFANNCVSLILTTDSDPFVIVKQFVDNIIYQSVRIEVGSMDGTEAFDKLYDKRCDMYDSHNEFRRLCQVKAILTESLFESCESADLFVWHYPTDSHLSFGFSQEFKSWLNTVSMEQK